jgi:uncharacterized protein YidB (DUF937 family)
MSDLINQMLGRFAGGQGGQSDIGGMVQEILAQNGGVGGLISRFQNAGLGEAAQSWVSNGPNQPIEGGHVEQVFGSDQIQAWADRLGLPPEMTSTLLAQALPALIDHFTPTGDASSADEVSSAPPQEGGGWMSLIGKLFQR